MVISLILIAYIIIFILLNDLFIDRCVGFFFNSITVNDAMNVHTEVYT